MLLVATFWTATVVAESALGPQAILAVKTAILYGMIGLVPALALAGGTGFSLAGSRGGRLIRTKKRRMPVLAANGLLILAPSAVFLHARAATATFDGWFVGIQVLELVAGAVNLTLLLLNLRDGLRMTGRLRLTRGR